MNLRRRQDEEEIEFQMVPMIDIVFQLLIFFMSASSFHVMEREGDISLPVAEQSKAGQETHGQLTVNVLADGSILVNERRYGVRELEAELKRTTQIVRAASVIIRGDRLTQHGAILEIMRACASANIAEVSFSTLQERR